MSLWGQIITYLILKEVSLFTNMLTLMGKQGASDMILIASG